MLLIDDNPSIDDKFGFNRLVDIFYDLIRNISNTPFSIGIFGEWGCGKTSLMQMLQQKLNADRKLELFKINEKDKENEKIGAKILGINHIYINHVILKEELERVLEKFSPEDIEEFKKHFRFKIKTVWFNPWKYDGKEVIWNALLQKIFYTMKTDDDFIDNDKFLRKVKDTAIGLAKFTAKVGTRFIPGGILKEEDVDKFLNTFKPLCAEDELFQFINQFEKAFDDLVKKYVGKNGILVIFIDDLDRCLPENVITILEAIKLYLDRENCIFIIGADNNIIEEAIRHRYKDTINISSKDYMEKIIQLPFFMRYIHGSHLENILLRYDALYYRENQNAITTLVHEGTNCNPRRIKRLLNVFWLYKRSIEKERKKRYYNITRDEIKYFKDNNITFRGKLKEIEAKLCHKNFEEKDLRAKLKELDLNKSEENEIVNRAKKEAEIYLPTEEAIGLLKLLIIQLEFPELYYELSKDSSVIERLDKLLEIKHFKEDEEFKKESNAIRLLCDNQRLLDFLSKTREFKCETNKINSWIKLGYLGSHHLFGPSIGFNVVSSEDDTVKDIEAYNAIYDGEDDKIKPYNKITLDATRNYLKNNSTIAREWRDVITVITGIKIKNILWEEFDEEYLVIKKILKIEYIKEFDLVLKNAKEIGRKFIEKSLKKLNEDEAERTTCHLNHLLKKILYVYYMTKIPSEQFSNLISFDIISLKDVEIVKQII